MVNVFLFNVSVRELDPEPKMEMAQIQLASTIRCPLLHLTCHQFLEEYQ